MRSDVPGPRVDGEPDVSVVVPYYRDQEGLDRLLVALELQTLGSERLEVIVADDGSPEPPVLGRRPFPVRVVRQEDRGFRAAAARNLGASLARGAVLAFLDGDMLPEPGYLSTVRDAVLADPQSRTLVVGRRRHADLTGWSAPKVRDWLTGSGSHPPLLPDPQWLIDGYAETDDLRQADDRSYRYVISALLAVPRVRFEEVGGFTELEGYGGEDWELAHRWRHRGGLLLHVPDAVGWQDGPDFAGREDEMRQREIKDAETLRLARLLPVPGARDPRLIWRVPQIAVLLDAHGLTPAQVLACVAPLLDGSDAAVWVEGLPDELATGLQDPRVRRSGDGDPEESTYVVTVRRPGILGSGSLAELIDHGYGVVVDRGDAEDAGPPLTVRHVPSRATWWLPLAESSWGPLPGARTSVESLWGR